ncbi:uncharacterized protein [Pleurodeles waltl]|uniref:uncharacterized protein isoform X4 n=1 Tax=Pleurodeles waltl TaxID=8319 RepID=UPI003709BF94
MSWRRADKVTFHDVAAYLSEEEWTSLSERQKEIYKNVMVEIHNAMIFLGYQIINADTLIRVYKGEEIAIRRSIGLEKRTVVGDSASSACDTTVKADILCRVKHKEYPCSSDTHGREETEIRSSPSTGDPIITSVFTLSDKEEEGLRRKNRPEPERREHVASSQTGDPFITSVFTLRDKGEQLKRKNLPEAERREHATCSPKRGPAVSPNVILKHKDDRAYTTAHNAGRAEISKAPSAEDPIITSVYTIRDKEQNVLHRNTRQECVRREEIHCSPKHGLAGNPAVLLKDDRSSRIISRAETEMGKSPSTDPIITSVYTISDNEALRHKTRLESERREQMDCSPNRGPPVNPDVLLKHKGVRCYSEKNCGDETEEPIITSVYTLRVKEPEALHHKDRLERQDVDRSPRSPSLDDDVIFENENSNASLSDHPDGERGENTAGKTRTQQRYRMPYTSRQLEELEKEFYYNHYITAQRKEELVTTLGLTSRQIKIWFQNRRAKQKRTSKGSSQPQTPQSQQASSTTPASPTVDSSREAVGGIYSSHFVP